MRKEIVTNKEAHKHPIIDCSLNASQGKKILKIERKNKGNSSALLTLYILLHLHIRILKKGTALRVYMFRFCALIKLAEILKQTNFHTSKS